MNGTFSPQTLIAMPRLAGLILLLLLMMLPPAIVLTLGWQGLKQTLEAEIHAQGVVVTRTIGRNPGIWRFSIERLSLPMQELHQPERLLTLSVREDGEMVRLGEAPAWPPLALSRAVYEYGEPVGRIELAASLRPVLLSTAAAAAGSLLLALAVAFPLYRRVLRAMHLAAQRLEQSERRHRLLFEQSRDGIVLIDPVTHKFIDFNSTACAQLGYEREAFAALRVMDIALGETPEEIAVRMKRVQRLGWADFEGRHRRRDGTGMDVHIIVQALEFEGKPLMHATFRDISARKQAEEKLREREEVLNAIFSQAGDAIELTDAETLRFTEFNHAGHAMLGYSREEYARLRVTDIQDSLTEEGVREVVAGLKPGERIKFETRHRRKDGVRIDVEVSLCAILLRGRKYLIAIWRDIGERLEAQEALRRQVVFTESVIDAEVDGISVCHGTGEAPYVRFTVWNPSMTLLTGYSLAEINRLGWYQSVYCDPEVRERARLRMDRMRQGDHLSGEEWTITRKDGGKRTVQIFTSIVSRDAEGVHVLAVMRDITERKRDELEIQQLNASLERRVAERTAELLAAQGELKQLNETLALQVAEKVEEVREKDHLLVQQSRLAAMGEMVHNIAHQWRQPLNALGLIFQNLKYDFDDGQLGREDMEQASGKAMELIQGMSRTIDDFRDFFRPDKRAEDFDPLRPVEEVLDIIGPSLANRDIRLEKFLQPGLRIHGHPSQFAQAVLNLVGNAKEAILGSRTENGCIRLTLHAQDGHARLVVADNAGGIPEDIADRIFDPYFTTKEQGSGIGLYMTRTIVERNMDGSIDFRNGAQGAEFVVTLPLCSVNSEELRIEP